MKQKASSPLPDLQLSKDLRLPADVVTQTIAILAMRGVGKTHTASVLAEEFLEAGLPFVVLDPTGAWWGLRAGAGGQRSGYPVTIIGGDHGDIPLEEGAGKLLADLVAEQPLSLVLDLSHLSKSAMRRFVADFAERLYVKNRKPLHLIIDEADAFAPQRPRPDETRMLGAIDEIVRRGRIRGLGCTLVTQRSAVLNKDVLTQTEVLVVLRTAHPRDRTPVLEWMRVNATPEQIEDVEASLAKLPIGDAWVMSAGWLDLFARVHIRQRRTYNSSSTPEPGKTRASPQKLASVDLQRLQEKMADTIARAEQNDPTALRRRIAELESALKAAELKTAAAIAQPSGPDPAVVNSAAENITTLLAGVHALQETAESFKTILHRLQVPQIWKPLESWKPLKHVKTASAAPASTPSAPLSRDASPRATSSSGGLRRMLIALAQRPQGLTSRQIGVRAGLSSKSGTFATYLSHARSRGWIETHSGGRHVITPAGKADLGSYDLLPTGRALADHWINELGPGSGVSRMLSVLVKAQSYHIAGVSCADLAAKAGLSANSGTFATYLSKLRTLELIKKVGPSTYCASEELL